MPLPQTEVRGIALRMLFWLPVLLVLAWLCHHQYAHLWLPVYRTVLEMALSDFSVLSLDTGWANEPVFKVRLIADRLMVVQGRALPAGFIVNAATPTSHALVHPVVLAVVALVWPGMGWRGRSRPARWQACHACCYWKPLIYPLVLASSINDLLSYGINPAAESGIPADRLGAGHGWRRAVCPVAGSRFSGGRNPSHQKVETPFDKLGANDVSESAFPFASPPASD